MALLYEIRAPCARKNLARQAIIQGWADSKRKCVVCRCLANVHPKVHCLDLILVGPAALALFWPRRVPFGLDPDLALI